METESKLGICAESTDNKIAKKDFTLFSRRGLHVSFNTMLGKTANSEWNKVACFLLVLEPYFRLLNDGTQATNSYKDDELILSERDSRFLLSIMENPPEPSSGLLSVFD